MDSTEDLSARILLKHILNVETPRTPLTRSVAAKSNALRRSGRLNKHDSGTLTPQAMLRRSLKHKMRESISSKTIPRRSTATTVLKQTPRQASMLFDDGDTPRHIFKNILLTEPVKSPVVNEHVESQEQQPSPDSSLQSRRPSIELSGLELSDLTIGNVETTVKRLNRKRPHRSLNVTAFEKRLKEANDLAEEEDEQPFVDHSSLSLSSSTSLSLTTPFIDVRTERKALQRKGFNRRKVSEEDFGAAVDIREMGKNHGLSISAPGQVNETTYSEGFTLGLSKISEPDITTDIVNFNTALYSQTDGIMANYSTLATQDKPTVMASQIQRDLREKLDVNEQQYSCPMEENTMTEAQDRSQSLSTHIDNAVKDAAAPCQSEQEKSVANRTFDVAEPEGSTNSENVDHNAEKAYSQTEDNSEPVSSSESGDKADIQTQNQGEDDVEEAKKKDPVTEPQSHQEVPLSVTVEEEGTDSQMNDEGESVYEEEMLEEEEEEVENEKEEMEEGDEELENEKEGEEDEEWLKQTEADIKGAEQAEDAEEVSGGDKVVEADSQEDEGGNSERITRRAVCAEDELIMPIQNIDADLPDNTKPEYYDEVAEPSIHKDGAEVEAGPNENKENTFQESGPLKDVEQVEQSVEEEEEGDFPGQTPAFVKQKRNFSNSNAQASPFTPKNIQPSDAVPGPKSKQKAQSKPRSPKGDPGLPKSYLMKVLKHFAKSKISADVYPVLKDVMDTFFGRLAKDLEAYALHARRSTIGFADCELLLRRQGHVNDKVPVDVLIEKYLRMDQRKLLIPIATSGNVVFPQKR